MHQNAVAFFIPPRSSTANVEGSFDIDIDVYESLDRALDFKCKLTTQPESTNVMLSLQSAPSNPLHFEHVQVLQTDMVHLSELIVNCIGAWESEWRITQEIIRRVIPTALQATELLDVPSSVEEKDRKVISIFGQILEVQSIFRDHTRDGIIYWIFTSTHQYDANLMDDLIYREMRVLDSYEDDGISFRYIPSLASKSRRHVVGTNAILIFER